MQLLVYTFMGLTGLAVAALAYFALTFTIIEALLTGFIVCALSVVLFERSLRRRAEDELSRRIEDLSKLLSTDAHAGQILSQRVNEIAKLNAEQRLAALEADMSVLGTVVQQVAESVAEMEKFQLRLERRIGGALTDPAQEQSPGKPKWKLTPAEVQKALAENRVTCTTQPILSLPMRRPVAYEVAVVIRLLGGETASLSDVKPGSGKDEAVKVLEKLSLEQAFTLAKQAAAAESPTIIHTNLSRASLGDPTTTDQIAEMLNTSTSAAKRMNFVIGEQDWRIFSPMERTALATIVDKGAKISIDKPTSLRLNFPELNQAGVSSVRADAARFVDTPESYAEFHSSDISDYISRYDIELVASGVTSEQQVLSLIEDRVRLAIGDHLAPPVAVPENLFAPAEQQDKKSFGAARAVS